MPASVTPIASTTAIAPAGIASMAARVEIGEAHDAGVARSSRAGTKRSVNARPTRRWPAAAPIGAAPRIQTLRRPFLSSTVVRVAVVTDSSALVVAASSGIGATGFMRVGRRWKRAGISRPAMRSDGSASIRAAFPSPGRQGRTQQKTHRDDSLALAPSLASARGWLRPRSRSPPPCLRAPPTTTRATPSRSSCRSRAGGPADVYARFSAQHLQEALKPALRRRRPARRRLDHRHRRGRQAPRPTATRCC